MDGEIYPYAEQMDEKGIGWMFKQFDFTGPEAV
jgi:hypothetical protein